MPNFIYKITDESFDLLKKLDAVQVWGEDMDDANEIEAPEDLINAEKPNLLKKFKEKLEENDFTPDEIDQDSIQYTLCIGRTEDKVKEFMTGDNPDVLFIEMKKLGPVEVNGHKGKYFLFFVALT